MPNDEILIVYFDGRSQWTGNRLYKMNGGRAELLGIRVSRIGNRRM